MTADDGLRTGRMLKRKVDPATGQWRVVASWPITHLGADAHGCWVGARRGTTVTRGDGSTAAQAADLVWLVPPHDHWVACFWTSTDTVVTVDIALPATQRGDDWTFDDLELDLYLASSGDAGIVDQDELDAVAAHLPPEVVRAAGQTADALLPRLQHRAEPFGTASAVWLSELSAPGSGR